MLKQLGGTAGSVITGACCLGFAPLLSALTAMGAGFLIRDAILIPLFLIFVAFTLWSLWTSQGRHGKSGPFYLGLGSAVVAFAALWFFIPLAYAGLGAFVAASVWDIVALRHVRPATSPPS